MGILDVFRRTPRSQPPEPVEPAATVEEQVRLAGELAVTLIAPGFAGRDEAAEQLVQQVADDPESFPDLDERRARQVAAQVWRERLAIESTWIDEGDYPALRDAFEELGQHGIVARMHFACCQSCGHAEIGDHDLPEAHGYTFFHEQDSEGLAPGGGDLYLAFGSFDPDPGPDLTAQVGTEVARTLERHGLVVDWDGSVATRIYLPRLSWRKRLPVD